MFVDKLCCTVTDLDSLKFSQAQLVKHADIHVFIINIYLSAHGIFSVHHILSSVESDGN